MATAFGARALGTALVVHFYSAAMIREGAHSAPLVRKSVIPEMTTKAVPSDTAGKLGGKAKMPRAQGRGISSGQILFSKTISLSNMF